MNIVRIFKSITKKSFLSVLVFLFLTSLVCDVNVSPNNYPYSYTYDDPMYDIWSLHNPDNLVLDVWSDDENNRDSNITLTSLSELESFPLIIRLRDFQLGSYNISVFVDDILFIENINSTGFVSIGQYLSLHLGHQEVSLENN